MAEIQVRHKRKQRSTVVADTLTDGARQLIVAPAPRTGFVIRGDIRRIHLSGETFQDIHVLARAEGSREYGCVVFCPVVFRVASHAIAYISDQVLAASQAFWRALKPQIGRAHV